jgi:molecular chaperone DnaK
MAIDNKSLGKFILDGIPPAPRGVPQIEVVFDIDANGILKVAAQDKASGRSQNITITASSGLAKDEVERMRKEAESNSTEDKTHRDLIDARNTADNSIYGAEKVLDELGDKVPGDIKGDVKVAVEEVRKVKDSEDESIIRKAVDSLSQIVQKMGTAAYHEQNTAPLHDGSGTEQPDPDVVDGESKDA